MADGRSYGLTPFRKTVRAMETLSRQILFATTPDTRRFKPLKFKDLRLV